MKIEVGCDIIEISRIKASLQKHGQTFLDKMFTFAEQAYCQKFKDPAPHFAARFAAKEAVVKALGTGISHQVSWLDIEVLNEENGKPRVNLSPRTKNYFNPIQLKLSMSHGKEYAMAVAIIQID